MIMVNKGSKIRTASLSVCLCAFPSFRCYTCPRRTPREPDHFEFGACKRQSGQSRRFRITNHRGVERQPRFFVEMKRWVAKDAAGLRPDREGFRSNRCRRPTPSERSPLPIRATRLLQNYGYLLPKANPQTGREQAAHANRSGFGSSYAAGSSATTPTKPIS